MQEQDAVHIHEMLVTISGKIDTANKKQLSEGVESLTMVEAKALFILRGSKAINMSTIARMLNVAVSTATSIIDRLVKKGLATRWVSDDDRRQWIVDLTPKARELSAEMERHAIEGTMRFLECLSNDEIAFLKEILEKIDRSVNVPEV